MLLTVDLAILGLIALVLWFATRRGRKRARRNRATRAAATAAADLIPGRPVPRPAPRATRPPATRPPATRPLATPAPTTWSASRERGEVVPPAPAPEEAAAVAEPAEPEPAPRPEPVASEPEPEPVAAGAVATTNGDGSGRRPAVLVRPRGTSWVVARDGASRVSSVHDTREAAEEKGRRTARRERVVLEVRDEHASVLDRTDYADTGAPAEG